MCCLEVSTLVKVRPSLSGCDNIPLCSRMCVLQSQIELSSFQIDPPYIIGLVLSRQFVNRLVGIYPVRPSYSIRADPSHLLASLGMAFKNCTTSGGKRPLTRGTSYVVFSFKLHIPTRWSLYSSIKWNLVMTMDMGASACRCEGYGRSWVESIKSSVLDSKFSVP